MRRIGGIDLAGRRRMASFRVVVDGQNWDRGTFDLHDIDICCDRPAILGDIADYGHFRLASSEDGFKLFAKTEVLARFEFSNRKRR